MLVTLEMALFAPRVLPEHLLASQVRKATVLEKETYFFWKHIELETLHVK